MTEENLNSPQITLISRKSNLWLKGIINHPKQIPILRP